MPNLKSLVNTLPDEPVCDCDGATPRQMLDAQLAEFQAYIDAGGCLRAWFLKSGIVGLVATAALIADSVGALRFEDGSDAGLADLRASLLPHIDETLVSYVANQIADIWAAPLPGGLN